MKEMNREFTINSFVKFIPYVIYTLWVLLYHKYMNLTIPDDDYFSTLLDRVSLSEYLFEGYKTWGSRLGVAYIQPVIEYYPWVFLILDVVVNISVMSLIAKILQLKTVTSKYLLLSLMLMLNQGTILDANIYPFPFFFFSS